MLQGNKAGKKLIKIIKETQFRTKRNFLVVYVASVPNGYMNGNTQFTTDGSYLNQALAKKQIKGGCSDLIEGTLVFTNIIELSEQDMLDWNEPIEKEVK